MHNVTFWNISGTAVGGALYVQKSNVNITDCYFEDIIAYQGGALVIDMSNVTIKNSVFWNISGY